MRKRHVTEETGSEDAKDAKDASQGGKSDKPRMSGANRAICGLAIAACVIVLAVTANAGMGRVNAANDDNASAQSQLAAAQQALADAQSQARADAATVDVAMAQGLDSDQVTDDAQTITKALSAALTWDSKESYDQARKDAVAAGLPADSELMERMLPEVDDQVDQWDQTNVTNRIDQLGLNSEFVSADVRPWSKDGDATSYVVFANADTREGNDGDPATTTWLVRVTCDKGAITSADAQSIGIVTES